MRRPSPSQFPVLLLAGVLIAGLLPAAAARADYRAAFDLTFPTTPSAVYRDDYDDGRVGNRRHRAIDLHAPAGAPVYAAVGGRVSFMTTGTGAAGHGLRIASADGRTYAYYHLGPYGGSPEHAYAPGIRVGARVERGQLIGYVGDSGNAVGGPPHLHFEVHDPGVTDPQGSHRLNPYAALRAAQQRGDHGRVGGQAATAAGLLRLGARGAAVAQWQRDLGAALGRPLVADGVFGPDTDLATRELQRRGGLVVDGVVGPATRGAVAAPASPARGGARPDGLLRVGDRGTAVREWQRQLSAATGVPLQADGIFATATLEATRELQRSRGLRVDGVVGPRTREAAAAGSRQ